MPKGDGQGPGSIRCLHLPAPRASGSTPLQGLPLERTVGPGGAASCPTKGLAREWAWRAIAGTWELYPAEQELLPLHTPRAGAEGPRGCANSWGGSGRSLPCKPRSPRATTLPLSPRLCWDGDVEETTLATSLGFSVNTLREWRTWSCGAPARRATRTAGSGWLAQEVFWQTHLPRRPPAHSVL